VRRTRRNSRSSGCAGARGEFSAAEAALDERFADETGISNELLQQPKTLARAEDVADGNGHLLLLEKGMTRLGQGDPDGCIELLRRARDELDRRYATSAVEAVKMTLSDDTARDYAGADYEHVLVRAMLAIADLLSGGQDAFAYAVQIGTKQEEILGSDFGEEQGYKPREKYRRIAIGAYLEGVIQEAEHQPGEAARAYQRAKQYGGDSPLLDAAIQRTVFGRFAREGCGVVHVFYLGGRGPHLIEGVDVATDQASKLAGIVIALLRDRGSAFLQAPIKVPVVAVTDRTLAPLAIGGDAIGNEFTTPLVDVNDVAIEQLDANLPWIQARALVRRGLKSFASAIAEMKFDERQSNGLAFPDRGDAELHRDGDGERRHAQLDVVAGELPGRASRTAGRGPRAGVRWHDADPRARGRRTRQLRRVPADRADQSRRRFDRQVLVAAWIRFSSDRRDSSKRSRSVGTAVERRRPHPMSRTRTRSRPATLRSGRSRRSCGRTSPARPATASLR
jgi:hypothetical protein